MNELDLIRAEIAQVLYSTYPQDINDALALDARLEELSAREQELRFAENLILGRLPREKRQ